jgi:electron transfer flavoprotein beta subunit
MNIIVPIKQVPETSRVKINEETGTIIRDGVENIINPLDLYAIEVALNLRDDTGGKITVISMGPPKAESALREVIAMGADEAILVSGKEFAGSDTWVTAYVLSSLIAKLKPYDLVITGERATDGDTGQVGPAIASFLDIPLSTYTRKIDSIDNNHIITQRLIEEGYESLKLPLPSLLTVIKEIAYPRLPTLRGKQKARSIAIPVNSSKELEVKEEKLGLAGSPTRVVKIYRPKVTRKGALLQVKDDKTLQQAVDSLISYLKRKKIV